MSERGMLSRDELAVLVERGEIETVLAIFPDMYGRLMGKRINGGFFLEQIADDGMHACDYLLACDMEMDVIPGYRYTSWETGYGDFHCVPDISTLRRAAWLPRTALVICDLFDHRERPVEVSPRRMLQALVQADRNVIYKHAAKEIAWAQGKSVTFMAKWDEKHTGSSAHVHLSLWNGDGRAVFPGDQKIGPVEGSDTFRWFLGGWMKHARALAACYAPYVAS